MQAITLTTHLGSEVEGAGAQLERTHSDVRTTREELQHDSAVALGSSDHERRKAVDVDVVHTRVALVEQTAQTRDGTFGRALEQTRAGGRVLAADLQFELCGCHFFFFVLFVLLLLFIFSSSDCGVCICSRDAADGSGGLP